MKADVTRPTRISAWASKPWGDSSSFSLTKYLAVFTEYKFKHWSADFPFSGAGLPLILGGGAPPQVRDIDFNVHLFYVGLAFHF